jgi:cellulose synthase/poly-beta-1,6-N-acetylglucosamine synthase-like glycosyltransferase
MFFHKLLFFISLTIIIYIYAGYPLLVFLISRLRNKPLKKDPYKPYITILIAAYNEENVIEETIKNKLALDYPEESLEIIVISDGSTDRTDEIVKKYEGKRVRLIRQEPRAGKTSALNIAVPEARGEILIFSDANSIYEQNVLRELADNFNDPSVGYVTGKMIYTNADGTPSGDGCTAYMKYENRLRSWETSLGSIVGVDGGIDAVRKELYQPMNPDQLPDFVLPLKVVAQGYRVVYEPEAILKESSLATAKDEYKMRVRVALRALWGMWDMHHLLTLSPSPAPPLSPSDAPEATPSHLPPLSRSDAPEATPSHLPTFPPSILYAWQLWSHKVLRYLCFIFLILAYLSNLALWSESAFYRAFFILQNIAYIGAALSPALGKINIRSRLLYLLNYFTLLNLASAHAFIKFLLGQKTVIWTPRKG